MGSCALVVLQRNMPYQVLLLASVALSTGMSLRSAPEAVYTAAESVWDISHEVVDFAFQMMPHFEDVSDHSFASTAHRRELQGSIRTVLGNAGGGNCIGTSVD